MSASAAWRHISQPAPLGLINVITGRLISICGCGRDAGRRREGAPSCDAEAALPRRWLPEFYAAIPTTQSSTSVITATTKKKRSANSATAISVAQHSMLRVLKQRLRNLDVITSINFETRSILRN